MDTTTAPPLDMDLNSIDTSMPLVEDGIYDLLFKKVDKGQSSSKLDMLKIDITTTGPSKSRAGDNLGAGVHIFDQCMLAPSGKSDWGMVLRNAATLTQAAECPMNWGDFLNGGYKQLEGRPFRARVGYEPAGVDKNGKSFKEKNIISLYIVPKKA